MDPVVKDILTEATAEFARHGLAGARVDTIAARTRTSKRMIYYHFGSKEGLYAAVLDHAYRSIRGPSDDDAQLAALPPLQALARFAGTAFDIHVEHPEFVRLVMYENLLDARFLKELPELAQLNRRGLANVSDILARGQADGSLRADLAPMDVYAMLIGQCFHHVSNRASFQVLFGTGGAGGAGDGDAPGARAHRRQMVVDSVLRFARAASS
jgi:AcrR family transcriptional regulator